jgi:hypothetical protein
VLSQKKSRKSEILSAEGLFSFPKLYWATTAGLYLGAAASALTALPTVLQIAANFKGGTIVGSPALAASAFTSGVVAGLTVLLGQLAQKYLKSTFDDRITKSLGSAKAAAPPCDKIAWVAVLIGNIDSMNPVLLFPKLAKLFEWGDDPKIDYWKGVARDAASYAHSKSPTTHGAKLEALQEAGKDFQFDQMVERAQKQDGAEMSMTKFIDQLKNRWFASLSQADGRSDLICWPSIVASVICIPTNVAYFSFTTYPSFLWNLGGAFIEMGGKLFGF